MPGACSSCYCRSHRGKLVADRGNPWQGDLYQGNASHSNGSGCACPLHAWCPHIWIAKRVWPHTDALQVWHATAATHVAPTAAAWRHPIVLCNDGEGCGKQRCNQHHCSDHTQHRQQWGGAVCGSGLEVVDEWCYGPPLQGGQASVAVVVMTLCAEHVPHVSSTKHSAGVQCWFCNPLGIPSMLGSVATVVLAAGLSYVQSWTADGYSQRLLLVPHPATKQLLSHLGEGFQPWDVSALFSLWQRVCCDWLCYVTAQV